MARKALPRVLRKELLRDQVIVRPGVEAMASPEMVLLVSVAVEASLVPQAVSLVPQLALPVPQVAWMVSVRLIP